MRRPLEDCIRSAAQDGAVLDVGCLGFRVAALAADLGRGDLSHAGVDFIAEPSGLPAGFDYRLADLNSDPIPFDDDSFDVVVAAHVIEHVREPIKLIAECFRVLKPGGKLYVEAPSERSLWLPGFPFHHESYRSLSFYDDPTHNSRPWTPQAFVRLVGYLGMESIEARHIVSWPMRLASPIVIPLAWLLRRDALLEGAVWLTFGWSAYMVARKPESAGGSVELAYFYPDDHD